MTQKRPQLAVSVALQNPETGAFLLVKRGRPPSEDMWAFAGGRVEFGETLLEAAARELREETGLGCSDLQFFKHVEIIGTVDEGAPADTHYLLCVHRAEGSGTPVAADDAADARWVTLDEMARINATQSTLETAREIAALSQP